MAELAYTKIAKNLRSNATFAVAWLVFTAMVIVAFAMWWEDYNTSLLGYLAYPTQKATNIEWLVAALPQLVQMAAIYVSIGISSFEEKDRLWYGLDVLKVLLGVWFLAFFLDGYWDYLYKSAPFLVDGQAQGFAGVYWPSVIESWGLYGFGSEVLGTFSLGMWIGLTKEGAFLAVVELLKEFAEMIGEGLGVILHAIKSIVTVFWNALLGSSKQKPRNTKSAQSDTNHSRRVNPPSQSNPAIPAQRNPGRPISPDHNIHRG